MEFIARGQSLLEGFQLASSVVGPKATREVTRNTKLVVKGGEVGIFAVGEEASMRYRVVPGSVTSEGEIVLPGETMVGVLREVRDQEVCIKVVDLGCEISFEGSRFRVLGEDPATFPAVKEFSGSSAISISASLLGSMLARSVFAASTEDTRYAMNGVLFVPDKGALELVATDGRRLAHVRCKVPQSKKGAEAIVPRTSVTLLQKLLPDDADAEVQISFSESEFAVKTESGTLFSRVIDGTFPPYRDVIPRDTSFKLDFDIAVLQSAVRRAGLLTDPASKSVRFALTSGALEITSRAADRGDARIEVPVPYDREEEFVIHFNPDYIGDCLRVIEGESVTFEFTTSARQSLIRDGNGLTYVIMPVTPSVA